MSENQKRLLQKMAAMKKLREEAKRIISSN